MPVFLVRLIVTSFTERRHPGRRSTLKTRPAGGRLQRIGGRRPVRAPGGGQPDHGFGTSPAPGEYDSQPTGGGAHEPTANVPAARRVDPDRTGPVGGSGVRRRTGDERGRE